ncbi:hypothetical protein DW692_17520 [Parabacteroides distasonis]|nr:hypothetical protein CI960_10240 [Parabacteroides sp. CT06]RHF24454.1 hypothetical protein DW692_17520 [Parabacteroides distasonis]
MTDTISLRDLHLTAAYNVAVGNRDTICCSDRSFEEMMQFEDGMGVKYLRTVTDKEHHIKSVYAYDDDRNLLYCNFEFMSDSDYNSVPIGREYKFNSQGNITEIINHEEGYSICCEQAMYIGDRYSKRKASKEYSKRILDRGKWQGKKVWEYHYTDKKKQDKMLVIDGNSGKILKKKDVFVTY